MNYRLIETENGKAWVPLKYNPDTDKVELGTPIKSITLDADDYFDRDELSVNTRPPIKSEDCIPWETFLKQIEAELQKPRPPFKPSVYYCNTTPGQAIDVYLSEDHSYCKYINPHISTYHSFDTDELVGVRVEGLLELKTRFETRQE